MKRIARLLVFSGLVLVGCGGEGAAPAKKKGEVAKATRPPRALPAPDPKGMPPKYTLSVPLSSICYSPDGGFLAIGSYWLNEGRPPTAPFHGSIRLWDFRRNQVTDVVALPVDYDVMSMNFTADGGRIVAVLRPVDIKSLANEFGSKQRIFVVDVATKSVVGDDVWGHERPGVAYDGTTLITVHDSDVRFWDPSAQTIRATVPAPYGGRKHPPVSCRLSSDGSVIGVAYSVEGDRSKPDDLYEKSAVVFYRSKDLSVLAWMPDWTDVQIWDMAPDGKTVYWADQLDWTTSIWDVSTPPYRGTLIKKLPEKSGRPSGLSRDGTLLATLADTTYRLYRVPEGKLIAELAADLFNESRNGSSLIFAPDGKSLAVLGNKRIQVWELTSLKP